MMKHSDYNIAVLLPCYNEAGAVGNVVREFKATLPHATIYVYDNNSTDNTYNEALEAGAIVKKEYRQGKGNVIRAMFMDIEADYYIMADGDGTYDTSIAKDMIEYAITHSYAMVIGVRQSKENKTYRFGHEWGNWMFTKITKILFGKGMNDIFSGYRVFSKTFVKSFPVTSNGFEIEMEMTGHALSLKLPVSEINCDYYNRAEGTQSKLNTYKDGFRIIIFMMKLLKEFRPLLMFSLIAMMPLIISVTLFIPILIGYIDHGIIERLPTIILCGTLGLLSFVLLCCGLILSSIARLNLKLALLAYMKR